MKIERIALTAAAGAEITIPICCADWVMINWIALTLVTDANAANRQPSLNFLQTGKPTIQLPLIQTTYLTASLTQKMFMGRRFPFSAGLTPQWNFTAPLPTPFMFESDVAVISTTANLQAGDVWTAQAEFIRLLEPELEMVAFW